MQSNPSSAATTEIKPIGSYLVEAGLLTQAHVDVALVDQAATGMRFGDILVLRGWIKEQTIEYLMKKIIVPEREATARKPLARLETQQEIPKRSDIAKQKLLSACQENDFWIG